MSSLGQRLYERSPIALQNALVTAYGYSRGRKRFGGNFTALLDRARAIWKVDEKQRTQMQLEDLRAMLRHAGSSVPYYRRLFAALGFRADDVTTLAELSRLPVLTKAEIREHVAELVSDSETPFWTNETSGSTGTPLTIQLSATAYRMTMALLVLHEEEHGIAVTDRRATFAGRLVQPVTDHRPPFWRFNWAERQMLCSAYHLSERWLPLYVDALERFQPVELIGYPSAIATLAAFCDRTGRQPKMPLRGVVSNSETLLDTQRAIIEKAFGVPVFDYYGTAEGVAFAGQCRKGKYHPHPLIGIAEVLDDDNMPVAAGQSGRLVCTSLTNTVMPLLRYEIGDMVAFGGFGCPCGRPGAYWDGVLGRVDDVVTTPEGYEVGRLDHIFKGVVAVREAQIAQTSPRRLVIRVVPDDGYDDSVAALLVENMRARVGSTMEIEIEQVDRIARTSRGKFRAVVNEMAGQSSAPRG